MNYRKTTWQNGDQITAEKLQNMEDGLEELAEIVTVIVPLTQEEYDALEAAGQVQNDVLYMIAG